MAMVVCTECGKSISDKATTCVNCGAPVAAMLAGAAAASPTTTTASAGPHDRSQTSGLAQAAAAVREKATRAGEAVKSKTAAASGAAAEAATTVARTAKTVGTIVLDQNADGKVDQEDVKILTEKSKELAAEGAKEAGRVAKEASKSDMVKFAAAGAIVGATIVYFIPFVGIEVGAVIGGALGFGRSLMRQ